MSRTSPQALADLLAMRPTILVTADFSHKELARLRTLGSVRQIGWAAGDWFASADELRSAVAGADILVAGYEPVTAQLLDAAPQLRLIASIRSEPRTNVDVDAATGRGVPVLRTIGRTDHAVAEFTVAVMLALARNIVPATAWMRHRPEGFLQSDAFYRETVWGGPGHAPQLAFRGLELAGRTLGLIGLGSIGRTVMHKVQGFDLRLVAYDPYVPASSVGDLGAELMPLQRLLETADFVSLHARLTPTSRGLLGRREFDQLKAGAYLINTARAGLVDKPSLLDALSGGQLAGAALDVFDAEPPAPDDPLVSHPKVLPTPHIAAWTEELTDHHSRSLVDELVRIASGEPPRQLANPEVVTANYTGDDGPKGVHRRRTVR